MAIIMQMAAGCFAAAKSRGIEIRRCEQWNGREGCRRILMHVETYGERGEEREKRTHASSRDVFAVEKKGELVEEERKKEKHRKGKKDRKMRGKETRRGGWNGGAWKVEERTRCCKNERLDTLLSMGLRQIHIATYISRLSRGSMRRCRGGVGSRPGTARRKMPPIACTPMIYLITGNVDFSRLD